MHSSSADTSYTFRDNTVAVADGGNQSSPGTGDSGTAMEWNNRYLPEAGAQQVTDRRGQLRNEISNNIADIEHPEDLLHDLGHPRQSMIGHPGLGNPQGNIHGGLGNLVTHIEAKDGMDDAYNEILEYQGYYEVELMQNHLLEEHV